MPNPTMPNLSGSDRLAPSRESWRPQREPSAISPKIKRLGLIAAGLLVAGAAVAGLTSLVGRGSHAVPVIEADNRPLRVKPSDPGGMQIAGADEQIMDGANAGHSDVMAPAPETPAPQALAAQIQAAHLSAPVTPPVAAPAGGAGSTVPAIAPLPPTSVPIAASQSASIAVPVPASARPPAAMAKSTASDGKTQVQLAAMTTQDGAMAEWQRLSRKMPDLIGSHHPAIVQTDRDGKTFYRLRTGGFADAAAATAFCDQVRGKGGACAVASF